MLHQTLLLADDSVATIAVGGGISIAILSVIFGGIQKMLRTRHREVSRREIAAYIAEGSMTADEGERRMNAGEGRKDPSQC